MRLIVRQIEQGAHYIRKSLIYSMRKAFLEHAVVELVYKFDEKSYRERFRKLSFEVSSINSKPQSVGCTKVGPSILHFRPQVDFGFAWDFGKITYVT